MKIIFVCTGNMSRSPFAECVLRQMLHERGIEGVEVSSVGRPIWSSRRATR